MTPHFSFQRLYSVARKEFFHIIRDPATLFFALFIPVLELFMLGYAIDTNVRDIRTAILDQCMNKDSERLLRAFENTHDFKIVAQVRSDEELTRAIISGQARVGIKIPEDFSRKLESKQTAQFLVLVDGSESTIAGTALNDSNQLALLEAFQKIRQMLGEQPSAVEARPRILFNPDTRSANFFIPGLMVVMCQ